MRFTEEHQAIRETVAQFIEKEINPYTEEWEKEGIFPGPRSIQKDG
ncbi:MAG: citronellyl-CoA dehydrogenase [Zhongshania sp.]|jgi:citronellyl-CoA dehydrogenase